MSEFLLGQYKTDIDDYTNEIWSCFPTDVENELVLICVLMVAAQASTFEGISKKETKRLFDVCKNSMFEDLIKEFKEKNGTTKQ